MAAISTEQVKDSQVTSIGASETDKVISTNLTLTSSDALNFRVDVIASSVVVGGGITLKLQSKATNGAWEDLSSANASVSITADGTTSIRLNKETAADLVDIPLRKQMRILITTGAGASLDVDYIVHSRYS